MEELKDGHLVPCCLMAIDAAGHSRIVSNFPNKLASKIFGDLEGRIRAEVAAKGGTLLGWAGDGGIAIFTADAEDDEERAMNALQAAQNIAALLPTINQQHHLHGERKLAVRIALHAGHLIWNTQTGSIHSADVNFVAHLEHAIPVGTIALSGEFWRYIPSEHQNTKQVSSFESRDIYVYGTTRAVRETAARRCAVKSRQLALLEECTVQGLVYIGFRNPNRTRLPPSDLYEAARGEILLVGVSLAATFKQTAENQTLIALRRANARGVHLKLLILDPATAGAEFDNGIDGINSTLASIRTELAKGRFRPQTIAVRGLQEWPHFTGVLVDGHAERAYSGDIAGTILDNEQVIARVQAAVPPEGGTAQHYAPLFEYRTPPVTPSALTFVGGFRYYWQTATPISVE